MKLEPFELERWLLQECEYDIASAGITKLKLREVVTELDFDMLLNYGITNGSKQIRKEIAALYAGVDEAQILVTSGTAEANLLAVYRLLEPADEVVAVLPAYMQNVGLAKSLGATVKVCFLEEEEGYRLDVSKLKAQVSKRTKLILLVNPNNPTGAVISVDEMRAVCDAAEGVGAWVLCDGALRGLEAEGEPAATPVEFYERGIATGSLSKIGLTGLRIGWLIGQERLIEDCWAYKDYTTLCHSGIGEVLATEALKPKNISRYFERGKAVIRAHRQILSKWIEEHEGLVYWVPPKGGHTAFPGYNLDVDSETLCRRLLKERGVLVSPGDYFGSAKHLRVRHSCDTQTLEEGLQRLGDFLTSLS
jgi:aspartate/methionine/tyrosine aminotransferase